MEWKKEASSKSPLSKIPSSSSITSQYSTTSTPSLRKRSNSVLSSSSGNIVVNSAAKGSVGKGSPLGVPGFTFTSETTLVLPRYTQLNWLECEIQTSELEEKKIKEREEKRNTILEKFKPEVRSVTKIPYCYRRNPSHFQKYSHPSSSMYMDGSNINNSHFHLSNSNSSNSSITSNNSITSITSNNSNTSITSNASNNNSMSSISSSDSQIALNVSNSNSNNNNNNNSSNSMWLNSSNAESHIYKNSDNQTVSHKPRGNLRSSGTNYYLVAHEDSNSNISSYPSSYSNSLSSSTFTSSTSSSTSSTSTTTSSSASTTTSSSTSIPSLKLSRSDSVDKTHLIDSTIRSLHKDSHGNKYYTGDVDSSTPTTTPSSSSNTLHTSTASSSLSSSLLVQKNSSSITGSYIPNNAYASSNSNNSNSNNNNNNNNNNNSNNNATSTVKENNNVSSSHQFNLRAPLDIRKPVDRSSIPQSSPPINIPPKPKTGDYIKSIPPRGSSPASFESNTKTGSFSEQKIEKIEKIEKIDLFRGSLSAYPTDNQKNSSSSSSSSYYTGTNTSNTNNTTATAPYKSNSTTPPPIAPVLGSSPLNLRSSWHGNSIKNGNNGNNTVNNTASHPPNNSNNNNVSNSNNNTNNTTTKKTTKETIASMSQDQLVNLIMQLSSEKEIEDLLSNSSKPSLDLRSSRRGDESKYVRRETVFLWNDRFQKAVLGVRNLSPNTRQEERIRIYQEIADLYADFTYTATTYGKIIISEVYLPASEKTIIPITSFGGVAGGEKYLCKVNDRNLYEDDEQASKVAGHEMKSLNQLFALWIKDIHYPLMCLIHFLGFTLVAMSVLPINQNTIIYGSGDAGATVHNEHPAVSDKVKTLARKLNIKEHTVGHKLSSKLIFTPIDFEVHFGFDKKFYAIDFSRIFPPATPDGSKSAYLYKLLRPEFVRRYNKSKLCSDAFSPFINQHNPEEHNQEVRDATATLLNDVIPNFSKSLVSMDPNSGLGQDYPLILSMHSNGINCRYIGRVRAGLSENTPIERYWRFQLMLEMVARTTKQRIRFKLRKEMRRLKQTAEIPYKRLITKYLNKLFGDNQQSNLYWNSKLQSLISKKFENAFSDLELKPEYDFKKTFSESTQEQIDGRCLLFKRIATLNGLVFTSTSYEAFSSNPKVYQFSWPIDITDLLTFSPTTKQMNLAQHSEGFVLKLKASKRKGDESVRLLTMAIEKFKLGLESNSNNKVTLRNLADSYMYLEIFAQADFYFKAALATDPTDTNSLFKYACFNERFGKSDIAEDYYLASLESDFYHSNCLTVYADFLASARKNYDDAERFYQCAIEADNHNSYALNNYACFLCTIRHNYKKAEEYFIKAIDCNPIPAHLHNIGTFYKEILKNNEESEKYFKQRDAVQKKLITRSFSFEDEEDETNNGSSTTGGRSLGEKQELDHSNLTKSQKRNLRRKRNKEKLHNQSNSNQQDPSQNGNNNNNPIDEFFVSKERMRKIKKKEWDVNHHEDRELKRRNSDYFLDDYYL